MPLGALRVSSPLPSSAARVYAAWLDALEHSRMTGAPATVEARIGGRHTAWDGYIEGEILELEPGQRILQTWRSTKFPEGHPPSILEIRLRDTPTGCEIWISHSEIPEGQAEQYEAGWHEHYFIPMTKYFREVEAQETPRTDPAELAPAARATSAPPKTKSNARAKPAKAETTKAARGAKKSARPAKAKKASKGSAPKRTVAAAKKSAKKKGAKNGPSRAPAKKATGPGAKKGKASSRKPGKQAKQSKRSTPKRKPAARRSGRS